MEEKPSGAHRPAALVPESSVAASRRPRAAVADAKHALEWISARLLALRGERAAKKQSRRSG